MSDDLYREICRNPEDDTLRLAYADWLEENGDHDRAEYIRSRILGCQPDRANAILAAHPEWSRCPCDKCGGKRWLVVDTGVDWPDVGDAKGGRLLRQESCPPCHGTGDLFLAPGVSGASLTPPPKPRTVTFARGFPDSVTCTPGDAFAPDGTPTPWACGVVRRTPVTRFELSCRVNYRGSAHYGLFEGRPAWDWSSANIPDFLMHAMAEAAPANAVGREGVPGVTGLWWWVEFATEREACDALALAAGRLVRRHVYGEVVR